MWVEQSKGGEKSFLPQNDNTGLALIERTLPVLLATTMETIKSFYDDVGRANPRANVFTKEVLVPLEVARNFSATITNVVNTVREEQVLQGSVFLPIEGRPHHGYRLTTKIRDEDIVRKMGEHHTLFQQLLGHAENLLDLLPLAKTRDARGIHYVLPMSESGPFVQLSQTWQTPAAERWRPRTGFHFHEVQVVMAGARGENTLTGQQAHVKQSLETTTEGRILPFLHEVMNPIDIEHASKRVTQKADLAAKQDSLGFDEMALDREKRSVRTKVEKTSIADLQGGLGL